MRGLGGLRGFGGVRGFRGLWGFRGLRGFRGEALRAREALRGFEGLRVLRVCLTLLLALRQGTPLWCSRAASAIWVALPYIGASFKGLLYGLGFMV